MLAVVEHDQRVPRVEEVDQSLHIGACARRSGNIQGRHDRGHDFFWIRYVGELDEPNVEIPRVEPLARGLGRKSRLPDTAGTPERHNAVFGKERVQSLEIARAAY